MGRHRTDELEGGYNSGHQPNDEPPRRRRGGRGGVIVPLAGAVALAVLLGVAAYVVVNKDTDACGDGKTSLSVVAAKDIAPAITEIAKRYGKSGACATIAVKGADSAGVAAGLADAAGTKAAPDLWIPDSSLWLASVSGKEGAPKIGASVAQSPVVLVAPKAGAEKLASALTPSWTALLDAANAANPDGLAKKVRVLVLDPGQNAAGLSGLLAGAGVLKAAGGDNGDEQLVGVMRQLSESTVKSPDSLFATLAKAAARVPIGITSEQSVWAFNSKNSNSAVALYPAEGTVNLDYPTVTTTKDAAKVTAAAAFAKELASGASQKTLQQYGFRTPAGKGSALAAKGLNPETPTALPLPDAATVTGLAQSWKRVGLGTRLLSLMDVSGTMALPADKTGVTRMRAIAQTSLEGLRLFPDKTEVGIWAFSTNLDGKGVDYKEEISIGPLAQALNGVTRRDVITQRLRAISANRFGDTGLNDTLWAAYQKMTKEYEADKINTILLFTDGVGNDDPDGGISNAAILRQLKKSFNPEKPISILIISFNTQKDENRKQMNAIAQTTGGAAYFPQTVLEIRKIFLQGISRRLCAPKCPAATQQ